MKKERKAKKAKSDSLNFEGLTLAGTEGRLSVASRVVGKGGFGLASQISLSIESSGQYAED